MIGLFEQWECSVEQICLAPGDLLVIFSDGVTEETREEEEFGEARLIHELQAATFRRMKSSKLFLPACRRSAQVLSQMTSPC